MERLDPIRDPLADARPVSLHAEVDPYAGRSRSPSEYFSDLAGTYRSFRPGYPEEAIAAILGGVGASNGRTLRVADVGCGTATAAAALVNRGAQVVGIDPSEAMLEEAKRNVAASVSSRATGSFAVRRGTAEATGLDAGSVDLVLCAQSFHWFDQDHALAEFARILVPGGRLALVWNVRDLDDPATRRYDEIIERARQVAEREGRVTPRSRSADPSRSSAFAAMTRWTFANPHPLDEEGLVGRARSASYFPAAGPERDRLVADLRELFRTHEQGGRIVLAQRTELTIADRRR